jgi:acyl-CoA synthetase (NDP forming)
VAKDLNGILEARSVAVIGASGDARKIGGRPIEYLRRYGFEGAIVPINPHRAEIQGLTAFPSLHDAPAADLAILATPAEGVEDALDQCAAAGVRAVVTFSAGYAETGADGVAAQERLAARARAGGITLLGPNCLGAINAHRRLTATFTTALEKGGLPPGGFSFIGQSGALGAYWLDLARAAGLGVAKWITTGNEADVGIADALSAVASDAETRLIGAYFEQIRDPDAFAAAAAEAKRRGRTILALKAGMSPQGALAAAAHTGSDAGSPDWYRGFLRECGVVQVGSLGEMIDVARIAEAPVPARGVERIGVVTVSGGAGVLICDAAAELGLEIAALPEATGAALRGILPSFAQPRNPIDVTGAVLSDLALMPGALDALGRAGACDAILVFIGAMSDIAGRLKDAIVAASAHGLPIVVIWMSVPDSARDALEAKGIPVFADIPPALAAIARLSGSARR